MPVDSCEDVLACLPPLAPGQRGILINDGEHIAWLTPSAPGQVIGVGPNGDLAFVNPCDLISKCPQTESMDALLVTIEKLVASLVKPKGKPKKSPK
jgi:hypothetical protein